MRVCRALLRGIRRDDSDRRQRTRAYATLGEIFAWMIGWDLILEYAVGSMTVAIGWSGYFQRILAGFGLQLPLWMAAAPAAAPGAVINLPAMVIVLLIMVLLIVGIRESARFNAAMVDDQDRRGVVLPGAGAWYVEPVNWTPFMPLWMGGRHDGRGGGVFCLHRIRRGLDNG